MTADLFKLLPTVSRVSFGVDETTDSLLNMESIDFGSIPAGLGAAGIAGAGTVQLVVVTLAGQRFSGI